MMELLRLPNPTRVSKTLVISFLMLLCLFVTNRVKAQVIAETFEGAPWSTMIGATGTGATISATTNGTQAVTIGTGAATTACTFSSINQIAVTAVVSTATSQKISTLSANGSGSTVSLTTNAPASAGVWTWWLWGPNAAVMAASNWNAGGGAPTQHSYKDMIRFNGGTAYIATPIISTGISTVTFWCFANNPYYVGVKTVFTGTVTTGGSAYPNSAMPSNASSKTTTTPGYVGQQFQYNASTFTTNNNGPLSQFTYTVPSSLASLPLQLAIWSAASNGVSIDDIVITSPASPCATASADLASISSGASVGTTGFGNWVTSTSGGAGSYTTSSNSYGGQTITCATGASSNKAWGLYSSGGTQGTNYSYAAPQFSSAMSTGNTVDFTMNLGGSGVSTGGRVGCKLQATSATPVSATNLMEFYFIGGTSQFSLVYSGTGATPAQVPITYSQGVAGLRVSIAYEGSNTFGIAVYNLSNQLLYSADGLAFENSGVPGQIAFVNDGASGTGGGDQFFNSVSLNNNPAIVGQSNTSISACQSATVPLTVTAKGSGLTYQWYSATSSSSYTGSTSQGSSNGAQTSSFTPSTSSTGTTYYYCAIVGSCLTTYSKIITLTVSAGPSATSSAATSVTTTTATLNGSTNNNGATSTNNYFNWGTSSTPYTTRTVAASPSTSTGSSATGVSLALTGLTPNTLYNFQDSANNGSCYATGSNQTFTTLSTAPTIAAAGSITSSGFTANWTAPTGLGAATYTYTLQYSKDNTFATGVTNVTAIASGTTSSAITGLSSPSTYYYRVFVVNAGGNSANSATSAPVVIAAANSSCASSGNGASGTPGLITDGTPTSSTDAIWSNAPTNNISSTLSGTGGGTPVGGSSWQAMFDSTNLYVLVTIKDNTIASGNASCGAAGNSYNYDGIDIYLDGANVKASGLTNATQNTYNRTCSGTNTSPTTGSATKVTSSYSTGTATGGYTEFITLPWANIAAVPNITSSKLTALTTIGFDVDYNDDQTAGSRAIGQAWFATNGSTNYNNANNWGNAKLTVCAPPTVASPAGTTITATAATLGATATAKNGTGVFTAGGVQYSTSSALTSPTIVASGSTPVLNTPFTSSITGLSPQTQYYYQGYATRTSFGVSATGVTASPSTTSFYTLSNPATVLPSFTSASGCGGSATLNWSTATFPGSGATAKGYVLLRAVSPTVPSLSNSNGAIAVAGAGTTIISSSITSATTTYNDAAVTNGVTYNYILVPYTWDNANAATYNYLTGMTAQSVSVNAASVGGTATATSGAICTGTTATLTLSGNTGTAIQWQQSSDNSTWTNVTTGTGATTTTYTTAALNSGLYYRASVSNGGCTVAYSSSDTVTVNQSNTASGTGWSNGYNDNTTGLGPWALSGVAGGYAGFFTSSSAHIDQNSLAWGEYANEHNTANAIRPITSFTTGNTISFSMQNGSIVDASDPQGAGTVGFGIQNASGNNLVQLYFTGGQTYYTLNDAAGGSPTTVNFTSTGLNISFTYLTSTTYGISVTPVAGGTTYYATGTLANPSGGQVPAQVRFFNFNSAGHNFAGNAAYNAYFNNLSLNSAAIVTPPSTTAQTSCGTAATPSALSVSAYGSNLTYQWYSNTSASNTTGASLISGATSASYSPPASSTTYYYYCVVNGACSSSATSNVSGAILVQPTNTWQGGSADWNSGSNWSCGAVPTGITDVEIPTTPTGGNYPTLTASSSVHNLILDASSTLGLGSNTFTITGTLTGTGKLKGSATSALVIDSTVGTLNFAQTPDTLLYLTLGKNATATIGSALAIAAGANTAPGKLSIDSNAVLNTGNQLTLLSNKYSTALVAAIPENSSTGSAYGTISGTVTVQRFVHSDVNTPTYPQNGASNNSVDNGLRAWRMLTSPVMQTGAPTIQQAWQNGGIAYDSTKPSTQGIGTLVTGSVSGNGIDTISGASLLSWTTASQAFTPISNTEVSISNGNYGGSNGGNTGYMIFIRGDRNPATVYNPNFGGITIINTMLNPTGTLMTGRQVYNAAPSLGNGSGQSRFTMIGNPYAAPVDLGSLTLNNIVPVYYIWNPNLNTVGGFVAVDFTAGLYIPVPNKGTNQYLQSGQAVLVLGDIGSGTTSVTFDENNKIDSNNNYVFRPAGGVTESFTSNLYLRDTTITLADGNLAQFNNAFSAVVDSKDIPKLGNQNETFSLLRGGVRLAIERRPIITVKDTLYLKLTQTTKRNYQFQFTAAGLNHPGLQGFLKDSYTRDSTVLDLNGTTSINFSIVDSLSQVPNRFMVIFQNVGVALPVTFTGITAAQQSGNESVVNWDVTNEVNIKSYEVEKATDGKTFAAIGTVSADGSGKYSLKDANAVNSTNYYRIRSLDANGVMQYSSVAKVTRGGAGNPAITVVNPIEANQIKVQFTNMPAGAYIVRLMTTLGQVLITKTVTHPGGNATITIPLSKELAKGVYQLEIINPDNTKTSLNLAY